MPQVANASFPFGKGVARSAEENGKVRAGLTGGTSHAADFAILGTGFTFDPMTRTVLGESAPTSRSGRMCTRPAGEEDADLGQFPYPNADYPFPEGRPGTVRWQRHVHCFNEGATANLGQVGGGIPGASGCTEWLVRAIAAHSMRKTDGRTGKGCSTTVRPSLPAMSGKLPN